MILVPEFVVHHRFKPRTERTTFVQQMRQNLVHNALRFGLIYQSEAGAMQLLRYYAEKFPNHFAHAIAEVDSSDVWSRRAELKQQLLHDFAWYVDRFDLKDQARQDILC